ncbi:Omp28-related outer membrane protein [Alloprevotella tannerae]|uniref:Omp28-related outer membrane protein n=1 Tax=Alloprevotella tannerae TaxID=76122 RepID=UPI0028EF9F3C|nr:Omp28-related outer membrane protein [Alloprevotella tannerae]
MNYKSTTKALFAAVALAWSTFAMTADAQVLQRNPMPTWPTVSNSAQAQTPTLKIDPAANQIWWGHYTPGNDRSGLGVQKAETYDLAIQITPDNPVVVGKKIHAVRFYLRDKSGLKDVKVWLSKTLPANVSNAEVVKDLNMADLNAGDEGEKKLGKVNDIKLDAPYNVTNEGVYVGVSFTVTSTNSSGLKFPIVTGDGKGIKGSIFLRTSKSVNKWTDCKDEDFGLLAMQVLVEGEFTQNAAQPMDFGTLTAALGKAKELQLSIANGGSAGITDFDYTVTVDGAVGAEKHVTLSEPYKVFGGTTMVKITLDPIATVGAKETVITITKVNGVANESTVKTAKGQLVVLSKELPRAVLVEENTGTGCGWCPRGMVGMAKLQKAFGDKFAGVAIHGYNDTDPMYNRSYDKNLNLSGAPSCRVNRGKTIDPYYGTGENIVEDVRKEFDELPYVGITLTGVYDKETDKVTAEATLEPLVSGNYKLAYVLVADGLTGSENAWMQSNFYIQFDQSRLPEDLKPYGKGGQYGQKFKATFDDVAIASSFSGAAVDLPALTENNIVKNSYTLALPTKQPLRKAIDVEKMHVIAFLLDAQGKVVNAAKAPVKDVLGVNGVIASENIKEVARYTIDGRRINEPQAGINIVKMSDGTTVKVLVK